MSNKLTTSLGQLIRIFRDKKGLSRTKLAEFCAISPNSMVKYEKAGEPGGKCPSVKNLVKICEVLEIDPRQAFDYVKLEDNMAAQRKYRADNPNATSRDLHETVKFGMRFQDHFRTNEDWMELKLQIKDMESIEEHFASLQHETHTANERLQKIEWLMAGKDPAVERKKQRAEFLKNFNEADHNENGPDQK